MGGGRVPQEFCGGTQHLLLTLFVPVPQNPDSTGVSLTSFRIIRSGLFSDDGEQLDLSPMNLPCSARPVSTVWIDPNCVDHWTNLTCSHVSVYGLPTSASLAIFTIRPLPRTLYTYRLTQRGRRDKQLVVKLHLAAPVSLPVHSLPCNMYVLCCLSYFHSLMGEG